MSPRGAILGGLPRRGQYGRSEVDGFDPVYETVTAGWPAYRAMRPLRTQKGL
jgi:hypothetical protein